MFHKNKNVQHQQQDIQQKTRAIPAKEAGAVALYGAVALDSVQSARRTYMGVPRVISFW